MILGVSAGYGYTKMLVICVLGIVYTWFMMTCTGGHYNNDMIIGLFVGFVSAIWGLMMMRQWTIQFLQWFCWIIYKFETIVLRRDRGFEKYSESDLEEHLAW